MSTPIILVCGPAGSGKDTAASIIARNHNGVCIALADPIKRLAADIFGFTEDQLWGPSALRNAPDERYGYVHPWELASERVATRASLWASYLGITSEQADTLRGWFRSVEAAHDDGTILTPRYVLQTLGTEWGRSISPDLWLNNAMRTADILLHGGPRYVRTVGVTGDVSYHAPDFVLITDGRFRNEVLRVHRDGGTVIRIDPETRQALYAGVEGHKSESELATMPAHFFDYIVLNNKKPGVWALEDTLGDLMLDLKRSATLHFTTEGR